LELKPVGLTTAHSRCSCLYAYDFFHPGVMMMMLDSLTYNHLFVKDPSTKHRIVALRIPIAWVDYNYGKLFAAVRSPRPESIYTSWARAEHESRALGETASPKLTPPEKKLFFALRVFWVASINRGPGNSTQWAPLQVQAEQAPDKALRHTA
jgi:hypothetical protein